MMQALASWSFWGAPETRNHFQEVALLDARIASEYREAKPASQGRENLRSRLRLAFAGPAATDPCICPA